MPLYLYNVQTTVEVTADNEKDAEAIMWGSGHPNHNKETVDSDYMLVEVDDDERYKTCICHKCKEIKEEVL